jgi:hypothetical protein
MHVNDLLLRHCGYFSVGRPSAGFPTSEGIHYIIYNFAGFDFVCNVRVFVEGEIKIHQITGDSEMFYFFEKSELITF